MLVRVAIKLGIISVSSLFSPRFLNDLGCREVYVDVLDNAGDQGDVLDLGEALCEVLKRDPKKT